MIENLKMEYNADFESNFILILFSVTFSYNFIHNYLIEEKYG